MKNLTYDETVRRIAALPAPEPRIVVSGNSATPMTALHAVTESRESCRVLQINGRFDFSGHPGVLCETPFVGPGMRHSPRLDYLPMRLSLVPRLFDTVRPPDAVLVHTSVPRDGKVSLGIEVNILPAAIERVRARGGLVMAQLNPQMPYTYGASEVPIDSIDVALEVDEPLLSPPPSQPMTWPRSSESGSRGSPKTDRHCNSASGSSRPWRRDTWPRAVASACGPR